MSKKSFKADLVEKRLIVWNPKEGSELYKLGYYGKPLGIPKPKNTDFDVPLLLDLLEGLYLLEKRRLKVYEGERRMKKKELVTKAEEIYEDFQMKYSVYRDLREQDLKVQPGIKFGCDFAVYEHGPGIDHAPFMIQVKRSEENLDAVEVVRAGRLATTVRKRFIVAVPDTQTKKINYLMFKWWKA